MNRTNLKKVTPTHKTVKLLKTKNKEKIWKAAREMIRNLHRGKII